MTGFDTAKMRPAQKTDALALAKLIDTAGEGIPSWLWAKQAGDGQSPLDIGVQRASREEGGFSYKNAMVAEHDGAVAGMLLSYAITEAPEDDPDSLPPAIAPFVELEAHSVGTWYINALAVFPRARGRGIGSDLLCLAETLAVDNGQTKLSIQVYAQNHGAVRLYQRMGYAMATKAPVRSHPAQPYYTGDVLLLTKFL